MKKDKYRVTGLMSGSSMDGTDLACCDLTWNGKQWDYQILEAETLPYDEAMKARLEEACQWSMDRITELDKELGRHYAALLNDFHKKLLTFHGLQKYKNTQMHPRLHVCNGLMR